MKTSSVSKLLLGLSLLLGLGVAHAQDLRLSTDPSNDLILTSTSCPQLLRQLEAICAFRETTDAGFTSPPLSEKLCRPTTSGQFSVVTTRCLPGLIKKHQRKINYQNGANCWGTALSFKKISSTPRFVWSNEMSYWLTSPLCRKLAPAEEKRPGDILSMYGPESVYKEDERSNKGFKFWEVLYPGRYTPSPVAHGYSGYHHFLHSETYLTPELSFGKDSPSKLDRFEFNLLREVYGRSRERECQEDQTRAPHLREDQKDPLPIRGSKCAYFSVVHRCENFPDYFSRQKLSVPEQELLRAISRLQKLQDTLFPLLTVPGFKLSAVQVHRLLETSDAEAAKSLEELSVAEFEKNQELLQVLKYFTASGLRKSLELARMTAPTEAL